MNYNNFVPKENRFGINIPFDMMPDKGYNPVQPKKELMDEMEEKAKRNAEETIKFFKAKKDKEKNKKIILYVAIAVTGFFAYKKLFKK